MTVGGMSKTYSVTGWRIGTILGAAGPHACLSAGARLRNDRCSGSASEEAGAGRLPHAPRVTTTSSPPTTRPAATSLCSRALVEIGFALDLPQGAVLRHGRLSPPSASTDDVAFARHLVRDIGVATVPGSSFFQDKALGRQLRPLLLSASATRLSMRRSDGCGNYGRWS